MGNSDNKKGYHYASGDHQHEYELIPLSPLRKLETRIDEIEKQSSHGSSKEFYRELVEVIRMNQQLVDELAKANDALRIELSRLPSRLEDMIGKLDELISFIKASGSEEIMAPPMPMIDNVTPLLEKMEEIVETNRALADSNREIMGSMQAINARASRPAPQPMPRPYPQQQAPQTMMPPAPPSGFQPRKRPPLFPQK